MTHRVPLLIAILAISAIFLEAQTNGWLKTKVDPGRAGVFVDGNYVGPAANFRIARKYSLTPGEHEVKLVDPRYQDFVTKLKIEAGKTIVLHQALQRLPEPKPPFGTLRVVGADKFDKYAAVWVNGRFMGHADEFSNFAQGLLLKPGDYDVKITWPGGGKDHEEKVTIKENQVTIVRVTSK